MKNIAQKATVYDADGYIQDTNVNVCDHGDTISIGSTEHNKSDLIIKDCEIAPIGSDEKTIWSVKW